MNKQTVNKHFVQTGNRVHETCTGSGRIVENLAVNGCMCECPSCGLIVHTKPVACEHDFGAFEDECARCGEKAVRQ